MEQRELEMRLGILHYEFHQKLKRESNLSSTEVLLMDTLDSVIHLLQRSLWPLTTESPIMGSHSDVPVMESITASMRQSSPWDLSDTSSGPVEPNSECAHETILTEARLKDKGRCQDCYAYMSLVWIPVPVADHTQLTSQSEGSNSSAETSTEASVLSPSSERTRDCVRCSAQYRATMNRMQACPNLDCPEPLRYCIS